MEGNRSRSRLRLNLFDAIVLVLALAVAGAMLWMTWRGQSGAGGQSTVSSTVQYTVRFQGWAQGSETMIRPGDQLVDNIKNFKMGTVVSTQAIPAEEKVLDNQGRRFVQAQIQGYEDILVTIQSPCTETKEAILLDGGYELRIGETAYIKGHGYMASGPVIAIEREGQA